MRRTVQAAAVMATLLAIFMAGGCASGESSAHGRGHTRMTTPPSAPVPAKNDCIDFAASVRAGTGEGRYPQPGDLPFEAHPTSLLQCVEAVQDVPGQGQWEVVNTVRSTGSVDGFVNALRASYVKPAQPTPKGGYACAAVAYGPQWIALIDADGTDYQIRIPSWGVCGQPDPDVLKALAAVPTTIASTDRIRQTTSPGAQAAGCPQQFAEMGYASSQVSPPATTRPFFAGTNPSQDLRACYYKLAGAFDKRDLKPAGDFQSSVTITGSQAAVVYNGLMNAPVASDAKSCDAPATEYAAVFENAGSGSWSVVELDGCKLAAPDSGPDRQAPAPVIQALVAAKQ